MTHETDAVEETNHPDLTSWERFRNIRWLKNHWGRPSGQRAYYWYLTFEKSPDLHAAVKRSQQVIAFPYYDLTPSTSLHLTLDRIAFEDSVTANQLNAIEAHAIRECRQISPFNITVGNLGGTPGAVGFDAYPHAPIRVLRDILRAATLSVSPDAPVGPSEFYPHVTIAYANSDGIPAAEAIAAVENSTSADQVDITVDEAVLVLLERRQGSYTWRTVSRVSLAS